MLNYLTRTKEIHGVCRKIYPVSHGCSQKKLHQKTYAFLHRLYVNFEVKVKRDAENATSNT